MSAEPRDWADELAEIILMDALRPEPIPATCKLIAMRLRKVRLEGECRGVREATNSAITMIDQTFKRSA